MTKLQIKAKIEEYQVSDAPVEIKKAAIDKLEARLGNNLDAVRQQIEDGKSDLDSSSHLY